MPDFDITLSFSPRPITDEGVFYDMVNHGLYNEEARPRERMRDPSDVLDPIRANPVPETAMQTTMEGIRAVRRRGMSAALPAYPRAPFHYLNFLGLLRQLDPQSTEISAARHATVDLALATHGVQATELVELIKDLGVVGDADIASIVFSDDKRRDILAALLTIERQMSKDEALQVVDIARKVKPEKVAALLADQVLTCSLRGAVMTSMTYGVKAAGTKAIAAGAAAHASHLSAGTLTGAKVGALLKAGLFGGIATGGALTLLSYAVTTGILIYNLTPDQHPEAFITTKGGDKAILKTVLDRGAFR